MKLTPISLRLTLSPRFEKPCSQPHIIQTPRKPSSTAATNTKYYKRMKKFRRTKSVFVYRRWNSVCPSENRSRRKSRQLANLKHYVLQSSLRAGFHGGPGPGPLLVRILKMGGPGGVQALQVCILWRTDLEGLDPHPDPHPDPHFENADKEGSSSKTSMESNALSLHMKPSSTSFADVEIC